MMATRSLNVAFAVAVCGALVPSAGARGQPVTPPSDRFAGWEQVVSDTHRASLAARQRVLKEVITGDAYWINGAWGDTLWCLSALYLNERSGEANDRLLRNANAYIEAVRAAEGGGAFAPGKFSDKSPWAYFALADYTRMLCLFRADSPHLPGRLRPETEAAMKEALWLLIKHKSKVADASPDQLLVHHGTENHDLTLRPNYYLVASVLKEDPAYRDRKYDDGHTAAEHYAAYNAYFRAWPRQRAMIGLWFEMGSDTYQKYSWPALINLHELSPDPRVRKAFGMLLDVALVEEAQVGVRGRRGGGRSRAGYGKNNFEDYKNLLYAPPTEIGGATHHKVFETSTYQAPTVAILLRKLACAAEQACTITNRVPGEMKHRVTTRNEDDVHGAYVADSALVNYAYRTPHYLLGCTLQDPSLNMPSNEPGKVTLKYSGISRQNRWSGMIFDDPEARFPIRGALNERADDEMCAVFTEIAKTRGGRPQHPHWSFQHENVLFIQRITPQRNGMGSYSTGKVSIRFHGRKLRKVEESGWVFASNGKAFVAVRFLDGGHTWDETGELASPADFDGPTSTTRVLMHAGDISTTRSFAAFRQQVLANPLTVEPDRIEYRPAADGPVLRCFRYVVDRYQDFKLPTVDGEPINLRPDYVYKSPYLNGRFGDDVVTVTVGPVKRVYDFGGLQIR